MAELYRSDCVDWWKSQKGYKSGKSKSSKYSKQLDELNWYNYKKNGYSDWCTIYYDAAVANCMTELNADQGRAFVYEPNKDNCGAGCKQKVDYYKAHNRWFPHKAKGCPAEIGDQVFFYDKKYISKENPYGVYHTGAVIDWNNGGIYTSEGNTNGCGEVSERFYKYSDPKLYGYGRPNWTGKEPPKEDEKPVEDAPAEPTPPTEPVTPAEPTKPATETYRVKTISGAPLALRAAPNTSCAVLEWMPNGSEIEVCSYVTGEEVYGSNTWVQVIYHGKKGYCTATRIKKV